MAQSELREELQGYSESSGRSGISAKMSEKWPPIIFQTSKPLGNMTALENQEPVTKEVDIVDLVYMCMLV